MLEKSLMEIMRFFYDHGRRSTGLNPVDCVKKMEELGAGEIFLHAIDRDGMAEGYDIDLIELVCKSTKLPVIACGGVGRMEDYAPAIIKGGASAVAAANIFHFSELTDRRGKRALKRAGVNVRL